MTREWARLLTGSVGYSLVLSSAQNVEENLEVLGLDDRSTLGSVFTRWVLDYRDSLIRPVEGTLYEVKLELADDALGSTLDLHRVTGRLAWLLPLDADKHWVLAWGTRAGIVVRRDDTDVLPLQHRFFNGGADSVRSFRHNELGPSLRGDPLGGEFFSTVNLELRTPLYRRLGAAFFVDGGNVIVRRVEAGFDDYRFGLGVGARYDLPIGPVRLDWGWNPNLRHGEDLWALHLSVGFAF